VTLCSLWLNVKTVELCRSSVFTRRRNLIASALGGGENAVGRPLRGFFMSRSLLVIDPADDVLQAFLASIRGPVVAASERVEITPREDVEPLFRIDLNSFLFWCMVALAIYPALDCCHPSMGGGCIVFDYEPPDDSPPQYTEEQIAAIAHDLVDTGRFTPPARDGLQTDYRRAGEFTAFQERYEVSDWMLELAIRSWLRRHDGDLNFNRRWIKQDSLDFKRRGIVLDADEFDDEE
jgi:hypothetical protein